MSLKIRGKIYPAPNEDGQPGLTGRELMEIEDHFGLDGLTLVGVFGSREPQPFPGYTQAKAIYALAWVCLTRGGDIVSIQDVLNTYSIEEFEESDELEPKKEATSSSEEEPVSE